MKLKEFKIFDENAWSERNKKKPGTVGLFFENGQESLSFGEKKRIKVETQETFHSNDYEVLDCSEEIALSFYDAIDKGHKSISLVMKGELVENVAKLRAGRLILQELKKLDPSLGLTQVVAQTNVNLFSVFDAENNILRTVGAMWSALLGEADKVYVYPYDYFFKDKKPSAKRLLDTLPQILMEESLLNENFDPFRGSYCVEALTLEYVESAWNCLQDLFSKNDFDQYALKIQKNKEARAKEYFDLGRVHCGVNDFINFSERLDKSELIGSVNFMIEDLRLETLARNISCAAQIQDPSQSLFYAKMRFENLLNSYGIKCQFYEEQAPQGYDFYYTFGANFGNENLVIDLKKFDSAAFIKQLSLRIGKL